VADLEYPDISHWRPVSDWKAVARSWRIITCKTSEGSTDLDSFWPEFVREARRHGMIVGAFHFLRKESGSTDAAKRQARWFIDVLNRTGGWKDLWFMLDIEDRKHKDGTVDRPSMAQASAFLDELSRLTGRPRSTFVSYLPRWWWNDHGGGSTVLKDTIYANSDYRASPDTSPYAGKEPEILQYTSSFDANSKGISHRDGIDMNRVGWTVEEFSNRVGLGKEEDISIVDERTKQYLDEQFKQVLGRVDRAVQRIGGRPNTAYNNDNEAFQNLAMAKEALAEAREVRKDLKEIKDHLDIH
jgi:GH25 family lysozyme M1 (1,4-beta-N-acetylmuramidase)